MHLYICSIFSVACDRHYTGHSYDNLVATALNLLRSFFPFYNANSEVWGYRSGSVQVAYLSSKVEADW